MPGYVVLARKYRSSTFEEVIAQEPIARTLVNAIRSGRVAHAYLFTGTRGVGKTTMARVLAKALNCLSADGPTPTPCNACDACLSIARGEDVDVVEIDGASNRGIEQIRELRANAIYRPARCRYKIYYIDEVHMLTKEAFNALLKTLEEPPEHVKFIFATTEAGRVPATVLSRCQRFDFRNIPTRMIAEHLKAVCEAEKAEADDDAIFRIARAAAGSMRDGLSLLDQLLASGGRVTDEAVVRLLGTPADERVLAIARAVADGDAAAALAELDAVLASGVTLPSAAGALGSVFRNMMIAATCGADSELIELPESQRQAVGELSKRFSVPALVQAVGVAQSLVRGVRTSSVARGLAEAALVRLAEAEKFIDPASLVERLEALSESPPAPGAQKKKPPPPVDAHERPPRAAPARGQPPPGRGAPAARGGEAIAAGRTAPASAGPPAAAPAAAKREAPKDDGRYEPVAPEEADVNGSALGGPPLRKLNTAERNAIATDPAVREVLGLFGGEVVDIRREAHPPEAEEDEPPEAP
jgi:DNA polymerase-3 subunit gamma/tau